MAKFFANLPAILEPFNPEAIPLSWYVSSIPDNYYEDHEGEKLHSVNDLPIVMDEVPDLKTLLPSGIVAGQCQEFHWYDKGKIRRPGDNPPVIRVTEYAYTTLDENGDLHSYNDMPASFTKLQNNIYGNATYDLEWLEHGKPHRENDLPAKVIFNNEGYDDGEIDFESYWSHGTVHRSNSLPCEVAPEFETWAVQGIIHNAEGYAEALHDIDCYEWALYGVRLSEEAFLEIRTLSNKANMPIWAAFLFSLEVITQTHLNAFMNSDGKWETNLPTSWILNFWNVTEKVFESKIDDLRISGSNTNRWFDLNRNNVLFTTFLRVLQSEENDALLRTNQGEESYV
jgi:hypothetical protein